MTSEVAANQGDLGYADGAMCHAHGCLLAVDTVASLGGVPLQADQLQIDVIYTGSQKVLGVPPGTAPISFSPRAVESFKARTRPPCSFYLGQSLTISPY